MPSAGFAVKSTFSGALNSLGVRSDIPEREDFPHAFDIAGRFRRRRLPLHRLAARGLLARRRLFNLYRYVVKSLWRNWQK